MKVQPKRSCYYQELLAKLISDNALCQGMTSVVPQMANIDSGFSHGGNANNRKQKPQGLKWFSNCYTPKPLHSSGFFLKKKPPFRKLERA
jgi:hypothetical protein